MPRQGLNRASVVEAAVSMIEEAGVASFSMAELAKRLNVKTASLYNHVSGMEDLLTEVGLNAVGRMAQCERDAIEGKRGEQALFALAEAYRAFAKDHHELYRVIMNIQKSHNSVLELAAGEIIGPIDQVLQDYGLSETGRQHWQRVLRSVMHGFAAHEKAGGFSHYPVERSESYRIAIECISGGLKAAGKDEYNG